MFGGSALGGTLFNAALSSGSFLSSLSTGFSVLSGVSSLLGGMQANSEAKNQANMATQEAKLKGAEAERQANREAQFEQEDVNSVTRRQKLAYLKSGVELSGSPLLVMEETRRRGKDNIDEIMRSGAAGSKAAYSEGRMQAANYKASGRQAFATGLTNAGNSFSRLI